MHDADRRIMRTPLECRANPGVDGMVGIKRGRKEKTQKLNGTPYC